MAVEGPGRWGNAYAGEWKMEGIETELIGFRARVSVPAHGFGVLHSSVILPTPDSLPLPLPFYQRVSATGRFVSLDSLLGELLLLHIIAKWVGETHVFCKELRRSSA
jgi:hypothetical protein